MSRATADLSALVRPGDRVFVALLAPDGTPTGTGHAATVKADGSYAGHRQVRAGRARVETINRPGRR
ncbi:hypothetical protein [Amycolatopsis suaedae]|uniref:Uncharacterized protein n=1 Tax=Amycolatopsis suaedae TaxID=2510978 RepID=A0A4Q7J3F3_9PSEU|nr:hypothetical protein [Amycolatopsis suaedae]RZQ60853.1 hypothetical protein EWH70_27530 [Amycolatopsis suaedae]